MGRRRWGRRWGGRWGGRCAPMAAATTERGVSSRRGWWAGPTPTPTPTPAPTPTLTPCLPLPLAPPLILTLTLTLTLTLIPTSHQVCAELARAVARGLTVAAYAGTEAVGRTKGVVGRTCTRASSDAMSSTSSGTPPCRRTSRAAAGRRESCCTAIAPPSCTSSLPLESSGSSLRAAPSPCRASRAAATCAQQLASRPDTRTCPEAEGVRGRGAAMASEGLRLEV